MGGTLAYKERVKELGQRRMEEKKSIIEDKTRKRSDKLILL